MSASCVGKPGHIDLVSPELNLGYCEISSL